MESFVIFPVTVLLTIGGLVFIAISYFKRDPEPREVESKFLILTYLYIALLIASFLVFWGASLNIKSSLGYGFGVPFSYRGDVKYEEIKETRPEQVVGPPKPESITYPDKIREKNMLQGTLFLIFGALFFFIHQKALRYALGDKTHRFLSRSYHLIGTLVYGGITVISLPLAVYALLEKLLFKTAVTPENIFQSQFPGELLSYAIPGVIIWYLFFKKITKQEKEETA